MSLPRYNILIGISLFSSSFLCAQVKPNILWVTIEDTSPQFIGCYGNKNAHTPVIDKLASEGVRFSNAFSSGTVSSPSRTCLITGVKTYETGTGNHRSEYPVPESMKGFPHYLKQQGYYVSNNNKTDYNVANEKAYIKEAWNESSSKAGWWNRQPGQPFFAVFNFIDSHQSRTMTESYTWYEKNVLSQLDKNDRIDDNDFEMPPFYLDTPEMRKHFARVYNSIQLTDNKIGALLSRLEQDHLKDSTIIFFFADHGEGIPRGKTNGINLGYRVPFIVWFPEMYKHLSPWGNSGVVTDELIDFEDLAPSMIALAGGNAPEYMKGRVMFGKNRSPKADYLNLSNDRSDNGIDLVRSVTDGKFMYSRNFMPFMPEARFIRYMEIGEVKQQMRDDLTSNKLNQLQKSLFDERPVEFLFDTQNDQWETKNLATDNLNKKVLIKMRKQLKNELLRSRDVMLLPEYEIGLISKNKTPYEFRMDNKDYPIAKVVDAALLSGYRDKKVAKKQIALLANDNRFLRYWGIVGLRSQFPDVLGKYKNEIVEAMTDPYPPVSVTAAAIAYGTFGDAKAQEVLKSFIHSDNMDIALMAVNYLLYTDNKEPFVKAVVDVRNNKATIYNVKAACSDFLGSLNLLPNTNDYRE